MTLLDGGDCVEYGPASKKLEAPLEVEQRDVANKFDNFELLLYAKLYAKHSTCTNLI